MNTKEKLLKAFDQFRPHINGHKTAMNLFFEAVEEVEKLQEQVKNCSIHGISDCYSFEDVKLVLQRFCEQHVPDSDIKDALE